MNVDVCAPRDLVMDHMVDIGNIQSSSGNISGDQHAIRGGFETKLANISNCAENLYN